MLESQGSGHPLVGDCSRWVRSKIYHLDCRIVVDNVLIGSYNYTKMKRVSFLSYLEKEKGKCRRKEQSVS